VYYNKVIFTNGIEAVFLVVNKAPGRNTLHHKACIAQSLVIVKTIYATVVILSEEASALIGIGDRVILKSRGT
jgi:hypothetical protein